MAAIAFGFVAGCNQAFDLAPTVLAIPDAHLRPDGDVSGCPASYDKTTDSSASVYRLVVKTETWANAEQDCADDALGKTHLIVLSNREEWLSLESIPATLLLDDTWIGLTARKAGGINFKWVTAEDTHGFVTPAVVGAEPWEPDQPDSTSACGELHATGSLHDEKCDSSSNYICECDEHPEDPANF
jgi:hypothetical protein